MGTAVVILILVVIIVLALTSVKKRIKYGSSCCGTHDAPPAKIKVKDKNKSHYSFSYTLNVDGMHCANCARRIENALNATEGVWATVTLENKTVQVYSKNILTEEELSKKISDAGYTLINLHAL